MSEAAPATAGKSTVPKPAWLSDRAWANLRTDSLLFQLAAAGGSILDDTLHRLDADEKELVILRWLKSHGIETSSASLQRLRQYAGTAWLKWQADEIAMACDLPDDMEAATSAAVRRTLYTAAVMGGSLEDLRTVSTVLHQRRVEATNAERTAILEQRLQLAETEADRRVQADRMKAAEYILEVLQEAGRMERLRAQHTAMEADKASTADHLAAIIETVWGTAAGGGMTKTEGQNPKEGGTS